MCLLPPPPSPLPLLPSPPSSLFLLTLVTDIPNSCCPTLLFCLCYSRLPACLRRMSLEVMTILCRCENIETSEGVPLDVTGVAQVMHFRKSPKQNKQWSVLEAKRKTRENGSTNKANVYVCVRFFSSSSWLYFFPSAVEGRQSAAN